MPPVASAQLIFETRALAGTDGPLGPGLGTGVHFSDLDSAPVINSAGQTAFRGELIGVGVNGLNASGIWSEGGGSGLALVARKGNPAPGTTGAVSFGSFNTPVLNSGGQTSFRGFLNGAGVTTADDRGIWSEGGGSGLALIAREGGQAPGTAAGVKFNSFNEPMLNGAGQTAFHGVISGPGMTRVNNLGIWSDGGGLGLALVARAGSQAPGMAAGVNFVNISIPALNGAGQTAFVSGLTGTGVTSANDSSIWSEGVESGLAPVAREGSQAPGMIADVNFGDFTSSIPALNDRGQTAFIGGLTGVEVTGANDTGIWSEGGGSGLALVARKGSHAPGTTAGVSFISFESPLLNSVGQTAFIGGLTGAGVTHANNEGIWSEAGGSGLALVAREGSQAPGAAPGVIFNSLEAFNSKPVLNGLGQTAFLGFLTGAGVTGANNSGIWATDLDGLLQLIVREGNLFDVSNDPLSPDLRTISDLSLVTNSGGEDGRPTSFNDAGQVAFRAGFTDGSQGIFVANTLASPATLAGDYNNDG
ncbi:DUF7453 family protein [Pirellulimonas nuda]|nr:choice-of-anchor tandem repeat NxxGxxAF-containing protein [Pirellulimonas nuda]